MLPGCGLAYTCHTAAPFAGGRGGLGPGPGPGAGPGGGVVRFARHLTGKRPSVAEQMVPLAAEKAHTSFDPLLH